ncbi:hypothetical protein ACFCZ6_38020 [Streptomyces hydrogenans]|uniref:hypothetical protein n=1 Tax=Streptomyces hydrogenans TaxID=1873719 RepID=UPI0035DD1371
MRRLAAVVALAGGLLVGCQSQEPKPQMTPCGETGAMCPVEDGEQTPAAPPTPTPTGLSFQQKQQILFKYCTSSAMQGPPGDSSALPLCMSGHQVTDQGMVMPK